jgi:hypothetical protein
MGKSILVGTGTLLDPRIVLTCAHCVVNITPGGTVTPATSIQFELGGQVFHAQSWCAYDKYEKAADFENDLAVVILYDDEVKFKKLPSWQVLSTIEIPVYPLVCGLPFPQLAIGGVGTVVSHWKYPHKERQITKITVVGYPGEEVSNILKCCVGSCSFPEGREILAYDADTTAGQSGSPIYFGQEYEVGPGCTRIVAIDEEAKVGDVEGFFSSFELGLWSDATGGLGSRSHPFVCGVHVYGTREENGACLLTPPKLAWLKKIGREVWGNARKANVYDEVSFLRYAGGT